MEHVPDFIVFTDLDGTFLDKATYAFDEALPAFRALKERAVPVIIVTSKTLPEVKALQEDLAWSDPAIVENGAAIYDPEGEVEILGRPFEEILAFFTANAGPFGLTGIHEMTIEEVVRRTGLTPSCARWARERDWTLPFLSSDARSAEAFGALAGNHGFKIVQGGRFYHLMGFGQDKGRAVEVLLRRFAQIYPGKAVQSVGLGDAPNDLPFLKRVTIPIVVQKRDGAWLDSPFPCVKAPFPGPKGWGWAIKKLLRGELP